VSPTHAWIVTIVADGVGEREGGVGELHSELARVRHLEKNSWL
jgi:hypothetical protein